MMQTISGIITKFNDPKEFREILEKRKIGLYNFGPGIGDHVYHTYFPEVYYKNVGRKVVDLNNKWCYDYNPYVERNVPVDIAVCPWGLNDFLPHIQATSPADFIFKVLDFKIPLRHPRLYRFENEEKIPHSICVHVSGVSSKFNIPMSVIQTIRNNYDGWNIFQIGGKNDIDTGFIDKRGLSMWDTAEIISKSEIFIGINSGMYHIANCYPSVIKKLIMSDKDHPYDELKNWTPLNSGLKDGFWLDLATTYYNLSEEDIGITYSYKKI